MLSLQQKANPFQRNHAIRDAIGQALYDAMAQDDSIHLFGEGAQVKMHYDAPRIETDFPGRVHTLPIGEDGNTNFAVGTSLLGVKPVVDVIGADFLYRTLDSICNTASKLDFVTGQEHTIVIRAEFIAGGPTTGQRPEAMLTHIPGLRVAIPSRPQHAYGLMRTALETPGVTVLFEDRMIQDAEFEGQEWQPGGHIPFGSCDWAVKGQRGNVTIVTYGVMRQVVEQALKSYPVTKDFYANGNEYRCDVIDIFSLYPIAWGFITKMLERTGRLLIVEPDVSYGGVGAEIAAHIAQQLPHVFIKRLGAPRSTMPASPALHRQMLPSQEAILDAIRNFDKP